MPIISSSNPAFGASAGTDLALAREALLGLNEVVGLRASSTLREWHRALRDTPYPPDVDRSKGTEIAREMLALVDVAVSHIGRALGGGLPWWAAPLATARKELENWISTMASPCLVIKEVIFEGYRLLLQNQVTIRDINDKLSKEISRPRCESAAAFGAHPALTSHEREQPCVPVTGRNDGPARVAGAGPSAPIRPECAGEDPAPVPAERKRGRPCVQNNKARKYGICLEVVRHRDQFGCSWEEACRALANVYGERVYGMRITPNNVKSCLRRGLGAHPARTDQAA